MIWNRFRRQNRAPERLKSDGPNVQSVIDLIEKLLSLQLSLEGKPPREAFSTLMTNKLAAGLCLRLSRCSRADIWPKKATNKFSASRRDLRWFSLHLVGKQIVNCSWSRGGNGANQTRRNAQRYRPDRAPMAGWRRRSTRYRACAGAISQTF